MRLLAAILVCYHVGGYLVAGTQYPKPSSSDVKSCYAVYEPLLRDTNTTGSLIFRTVFKRHPETRHYVDHMSPNDKDLYKSPKFLNFVSTAVTTFGIFIRNMRDGKLEENQKMLDAIARKHERMGVKTVMTEWFEEAMLSAMHLPKTSPHLKACKRVLDYLLLNDYNPLLSKYYRKG